MDALDNVVQQGESQGRRLVQRERGPNQGMPEDAAG